MNRQQRIIGAWLAYMSVAAAYNVAGELTGWQSTLAVAAATIVSTLTILALVLLYAGRPKRRTSPARVARPRRGWR